MSEIRAACPNYRHSILVYTVQIYSEQWTISYLISGVRVRQRKLTFLAEISEKGVGLTRIRLAMHFFYIHI